MHNMLVCCARSLQKVYQIFIFTYFSSLFQSVGIKISCQRSWTLLLAEIKRCGLNFMVERGKVGVKQKNNFIVENCFIKQHVTVFCHKTSTEILNLVPRVSLLPFLQSKRDKETLVRVGPVSPRVWEISKIEFKRGVDG